MRALAAGVLVLLVGCVADPSEAPPPGSDPSGSDTGSDTTPAAIDLTHAKPCDGTTVLQGYTSGSPQSVTISARTYDSAGALFCLELDARQNVYMAHFAAGTDYEASTTSSFQMALFDASATMLRQSWDVSVGSTDPNTFENLEYGVGKGSDITVTLFVGAKTGSATSELRLNLFEPYE